MAARCKSPLWFAHIEDLLRKWRTEADHSENITIYDIGMFLRAKADELEETARHDQHDNHHDGEFVDGCEYCDTEREQYG